MTRDHHARPARDVARHHHRRAVAHLAGALTAAVIAAATLRAIHDLIDGMTTPTTAVWAAIGVAAAVAGGVLLTRGLGEHGTAGAARTAWAGEQATIAAIVNSGARQHVYLPPPATPTPSDATGGHVVHDLAAAHGGAHVVLGPAAAVIVTHTRTGRLSHHGTHITCGTGRIPGRIITGAAQLAAALAEHTHTPAGPPVPVTAIVCVTGATGPVQHHHGVIICALTDLTTTLYQLPAVLTDADADTLAGTVLGG